MGCSATALPSAFTVSALYLKSESKQRLQQQQPPAATGAVFAFQPHHSISDRPLWKARVGTVRCVRARHVN